MYANKEVRCSKKGFREAIVTNCDPKSDQGNIDETWLWLFGKDFE